MTHLDKVGARVSVSHPAVADLKLFVRFKNSLDDTPIDITDQTVVGIAVDERGYTSDTYTAEKTNPTDGRATLTIPVSYMKKLENSGFGEEFTINLLREGVPQIEYTINLSEAI